MSSIKVLIVEDEASIRSMFAYKLQLEGFEVYEAENGQVGLEVAKKEKPELILLDLKMPVMSGDEMLTKLRECDWGANIRVIVLTNLNKSEAPSSLRFLDVERYIVKAHSTPTQVVEVIENVLGENT
jgi:two-component system alkaline phosphatase synthesis response regulator PhoP